MDRWMKLSTIVRYLTYINTHSFLILYWMMGFEWNNKHMKGLIKNPHHPDVSLTVESTKDISSRFINLKIKQESNVQPHRWFLCGVQSVYVPTEREVNDLQLLGVELNLFNVIKFPMVYILNLHFRSGEWGQSPWCGSMITCVIGGRSL